MFGDTLEAWDYASEAIKPEQRDAGKVAMAQAALAKSNPFGKKEVTDKSPKTRARKVARDDSTDDPLALKVKAVGKITRTGRVKDSIKRSRKVSNPNIPGLKPGQTESESMFDDLLEAWDYMEAATNRKEADPTALRLGHRLARGLTRQSQEAPAAGPPPTPGTKAHAQHRRKTMVKSLGMKMVGGNKKTPPPAPIPKGTTVAGVDLGDSKNESFFAVEFRFWMHEYAGQVTQTAGGASVSGKERPRDAARAKAGKSLRHPMGWGSPGVAAQKDVKARANIARTKGAEATGAGLAKAQQRTGRTFSDKKVGAATRQGGESAANRAVGRAHEKRWNKDPLAAKVGASPEAKRKIIRTGRMP
jgi:hypothetical protein